MLNFIYNLIIHVYKGLISFVSLFNQKARLRTSGVLMSFREVTKCDFSKDEQRILIHCSSQGEHEQALPIIRWILENTSFNIVLSFFSPSGYENSDYENNKRVIKTYLPFDLKTEMSQFINSIKPRLVIIIKNEWWWNLLRELKHQKIPTYLISATIRNEHYFVKFPLHFFRNRFSVFEKTFVVDGDSMQNLAKIYNGKIIISGDTRIDQANHNKEKVHGQNSNKFPDNTKKQNKTLVYGSVWASDIESINMLIHLNQETTHLIFPHNLKQKNIDNLKGKIKNAKVISSTADASDGVNIISTMGELKFAYNLAYNAYIGGGFGVGIHNVLEAAVYYIPTLFGPNHQKSNEALYLASTNCAFPIQKPIDLKDISEKINEEKNRNEIETKLKSYFSLEYSPTEIICKEIFK